jgi:hypothetical protein
MGIFKSAVADTTPFSARKLLLACVLALSLSMPVFAQSAAPGGALKCTQLLSSEQVKGIAGNGMEAQPPQQHEAGESECVWRRGTGDSAISLAIRFFDRQAIGSNPVSRTPDGYFEMLVKAGEEVGGKKREAVTGVPRAVLIQAPPQILVVVQRHDGVARIVLGNLSRAQAVAVAKTVAVP